MIALDQEIMAKVNNHIAAIDANDNNTINAINANAINANAISADNNNTDNDSNNNNI